MPKGKNLLTNSVGILKNTVFYDKFKSFEKVTKRVVSDYGSDVVMSSLKDI